MATRPKPTNATVQRIRAPHERALRRKLHDSSIELEKDFTQFALDRDLLMDMNRAAVQLGYKEPDGLGEKGYRISGEKAKRLPEEVSRIIDRALARAEPLFAEFEIEIAAGLLSESVRSYEAGARSAIRFVGMQGQFNLRNESVLDALADRANKLAGDVADTTFDAMKQTIGQKFFVEGRGPVEVARALRNEFDFLSAARSSTIARTETGVVTEMGAFEEYAEIGIERKRWISALVEQTRPGHRKANGQTVELFEPFLVDDADGNPEEMLHPMDPDASPGNVCNCLCSSAPIVEGGLGEPWLGE
jgi:hypothetical protein